MSEAKGNLAQVEQAAEEQTSSSNGENKLLCVIRMSVLGSPLPAFWVSKEWDKSRSKFISRKEHQTGLTLHGIWVALDRDTDALNKAVPGLQIDSIWEPNDEPIKDDSGLAGVLAAIAAKKAEA